MIEVEFGYQYKGKTKWTKIAIEEISNMAGKTSIGKARGDDLEHCIALGWMHHKNFLEEVKYYRFCDESSPKYPVVVEFYK